MMDHSDVIGTAATEKYLLDQLGDDDRARYEAHFFECQECAEDLQLTETFLAGARKVLARDAQARDQAPAAERRRSGWAAFFWPMPVGAAAAMLLLVAVVGYQNLSSVPRLRDQLAAAEAPQPASWHFLAVSRGEPPVIVASRRHRMIGLTLGQPAGPPLPSYRCEVRDATGRVVWSFVVPGPAQGGEIEIVIPASQLRPGAYVVALAGAGSADLARYPFTIQLGED